MPIILLGLLVIVGLLVYMYYTGELGSLSHKPKKKESESPNDDDDDDLGKVIYLPNDVEKEKKKRNVKTGKD